MRRSATACRSRPRRAPTAISAAWRCRLHPGTNPSWLVFALSNPTGDRVTRWLVAPRYSFMGSRVFWPDLDAGRIEAVTPSLGFRPERLASDRADMFRVSLDPGQTVTFAAELDSCRKCRACCSGIPTLTESSSKTACAVPGRPARHHRPARHFLDGDLCRQPPGDLSGHRARGVGGARLFLRRFRFLEQAVPGGRGAHGAVSRRVRSRSRRHPRALSLYLLAHRAVARLDPHFVLGLDRRPIRSRHPRRHRSAPCLRPGPRSRPWASPRSAQA